MGAVERLGFATGSTVAVVHADDIGMSHAANVGAFAGLDAGPVTCGSVMMPCPWSSEAAEMARERPGVDLGVHLTLNAEFDGYRWGPVAGRGAVPSLVDDAGHLFRTRREVVKYGSVDDVRTELRAQVDAALAAGIDVTHLDSHMGTVFHPKFFEVYLELGREHRLPLFLPRVEELRPDPDGFVVFDGYDADSLDFAPGDGEPHNARRIQGLGPGLNYLICHPAQGGDELSAITPPPISVTSSGSTTAGMRGAPHWPPPASRPSACARCATSSEPRPGDASARDVTTRRRRSDDASASTR